LSRFTVCSALWPSRHLRSSLAGVAGTRFKTRETRKDWNAGAAESSWYSGLGRKNRNALSAAKRAD
jgi:hypothetical protein